MATNSDQIIGSAKDGLGKAQENVGNAVGSDKLAGKGIGNQTEGKIQKGFGDAKDAVQDGLRKVADKL